MRVQHKINVSEDSSTFIVLYQGAIVRKNVHSNVYIQYNEI